MPPSSAAVRLTDFEPEVDDFAEDVRRGLAATPKQLHPKYFYDAAGSKLFDRICATSEYYPTRTEIAIMERYAGEMAALAGPRVRLVEFGSGSSVKTRLLLAHLDQAVASVKSAGDYTVGGYLTRSPDGRRRRARSGLPGSGGAADLRRFHDHVYAA